MRINSNLNSGGVDGTVAPKRPAPTAPAAADPASFAAANALDNSMQTEPDSRPEAVDRAQALVRDASYPPPEVLGSVADLLAKNITSSGE